MSPDSPRSPLGDPSPARVRLERSPPISLAELRALFVDAGTLDPDVDLRGLLKRALFYVCAFDARGRLVGFAKVIDDGGVHGFLLDPTLLSSLRRQGIGAALVSASAQEARARGIQWLHVDYEPQLEPFYRRCGFVPSKAGVMNLRTETAQNSPPLPKS